MAQGTRHDREGDTLTRRREKVERPKRYRVLLHNDDYTTMDFVIKVLVLIFNKDPMSAYKIMMNVHTTGKGVCGIYPREIAEAKVKKVHQQAKAAGFPLKSSMEPADE